MSELAMQSASKFLISGNNIPEKINYKDEHPRIPLHLKYNSSEKSLSQVQSYHHSSLKSENNLKNLNVQDEKSEMLGMENMKSNETPKSLHSPSVHHDFKFPNMNPGSVSDSRLLLKRRPLRSKLVSNKGFGSLEPTAIYHSGSKVIIDLGKASTADSESKLANQENRAPSTVPFDSNSKRNKSSFEKTYKPILKIGESKETFPLKEYVDDLKVICLKGRKTVIEINNMNPKLDFSVSHQKAEGKLIVTVSDRLEQFTCNASPGNTRHSSTSVANEVKYKEKEKRHRWKNTESKSRIFSQSKSSLSRGKSSSHKHSDDSSESTGPERQLPGLIDINSCLVLPQSVTLLLLESLNKHNKTQTSHTNKNDKHVVFKTEKNSVEKCTKKNERKVNKTRKTEENFLPKELHKVFAHSEDSCADVGEFQEESNEYVGRNSSAENSFVKPKTEDDINSSEVPEIKTVDTESETVCKDHMACLNEASEINHQSSTDLLQQRQSQLVNNLKKTKECLQKPKIKKKSVDEVKKIKFDPPASKNTWHKSVNRNKKIASPGNYLDPWNIKGTLAQSNVVTKSAARKKSTSPFNTAKKSPKEFLKSKNSSPSSDRKQEEKDMPKKSANCSNPYWKQSKKIPPNVEEKTVSEKRSSRGVKSSAVISRLLQENTERLQSNTMLKPTCFDPTIYLGKVRKEKHKISTANSKKLRYLIRNKIIDFVSIINESGFPLSKYGSRSDTYANTQYPFPLLPGCNLSGHLSCENYPRKFTLNKDMVRNIPIVRENEANAGMGLTRKSESSVVNNLNSVSNNRENEHYSDITYPIETLLFPMSCDKGRKSAKEFDGVLTKDTMECNVGMADLHDLAKRGTKRNIDGVPTGVESKTASCIASIYTPQSNLISIEQNTPHCKEVQKSQDSTQNLANQDIRENEGNTLVIKLNDNILPVIRNFSKLTEQLRRQLHNGNEDASSSKRGSQERTCSHSKIMDSNNSSEYIINNTNISINSLASVLSYDEDQCKVKHENSRNYDLEAEEDTNNLTGNCNTVSTCSLSDGLSTFPSTLADNNCETQSLGISKYYKPEMDNSLAYKKFPYTLKRDRTEPFNKASTDLTGSEFVRADEYFPVVDLESEIDLGIKDDNYSLISSGSATSISLLSSSSKQAGTLEGEVDFPDLEGALNTRPTSSFYFFVEEGNQSSASAVKIPEVSAPSIFPQRKSRAKKFVRRSGAFMKLKINDSVPTSTAPIPWAVPIKVFNKKKKQSAKSSGKLVKGHDDDDPRKILKKNDTSAKQNKKNYSKTFFCSVTEGTKKN